MAKPPKLVSQRSAYPMTHSHALWSAARLNADPDDDWRYEVQKAGTLYIIAVYSDDNKLLGYL